MRTEELNKQKWARERGSEKKSGKKIVPGSGPFLDSKGSDAWRKFYHEKSFKGKYSLHFIKRPSLPPDFLNSIVLHFSSEIEKLFNFKFQSSVAQLN